MGAPAVTIVVVAVIAAGGAQLMRFGLRGELGSRVLARALHASAGRRRMARLSGEAHARVFGAARGRLLGCWFGAPVLVIETKGRRSGLPRRTPIVYAPDGDRFVVTPANAGADQMPAWWLNLHAARTATALVAGRRVAVRAVEAERCRARAPLAAAAGDEPGDRPLPGLHETSVPRRRARAAARD